MMPLKVSVVICTCDRPKELEACLRSIAKQTVVPHEVLVIENQIQSESTVQLARSYRTRYENVATGGVSACRNRGWQLANGDVIAYIDDDAVAQSDWIERLSEEFCDEAVAAVAGRIVPTSVETGFERTAYLCGVLGPVEARRTVYSAQVEEWFEALNFGCIANGANMAFRRGVISRFPFDERLGRGLPVESFADHHSFFCIVANGFSAVYSDKAIVSHPVPAKEDEYRRRELNNLRAAGGYCTLLWFEWPQYRSRLLAYLASGFRDRTREFRQAQQEFPVLPKRTKIRAGMAGTLRYFLHVYGRNRHRSAEII